MFGSTQGIARFFEDILTTSQNLSEHVERLEYVFSKLADCGLRVHKEKN